MSDITNDTATATTTVSNPSAPVSSATLETPDPAASLGSIPPVVPPVAPPATPDPPAEHPAAASISAAQYLYEVIGQDLALVGAWLHANAAGAFADVEEAISHIEGKTPKV